MSDVITLRKLTEKSTLKFGQYHDIPIYNLLDLKYYTYLRWVYYNCSNITFMDNILLEIGLKEDEFIEKPSKNPEMYNIITERIRSNIDDYGLKQIEKVSDKRFKGKKSQENRDYNIQFSKSKMIRKNHGH